MVDVMSDVLSLVQCDYILCKLEKQFDKPVNSFLVSLNNTPVSLDDLLVSLMCSPDMYMYYQSIQKFNNPDPWSNYLGILWFKFSVFKFPSLGEKWCSNART